MRFFFCTPKWACGMFFEEIPTNLRVFGWGELKKNNKWAIHPCILSYPSLRFLCAGSWTKTLPSGSFTARSWWRPELAKTSVQLVASWTKISDKKSQIGWWIDGEGWIFWKIVKDISVKSLFMTLMRWYRGETCWIFFMCFLSNIAIFRASFLVKFQGVLRIFFLASVRWEVAIWAFDAFREATSYHFQD